MRELSKRKQLENLIKSTAGKVVLNDLAHLEKRDGNTRLFIKIAGKTQCYTVSHKKYEYIVEEIEQIIERCLERYAREATRELYYPN